MDSMGDVKFLLLFPVLDCPSCLWWSLVYQGSKNLRESPTVLFFPTP